MSKAQKFKDKYVADIRNRDVEARGGYDPRFDKRSKPVIKDEPATPPSNLGLVNPSTGTAAPGKAQPSAVADTPAKVEAPVVEFDPQNALFYGDSIATGLGHGGKQGDDNSDAQWGRGAAGTLALLNSRPEGTFKGQDVVLSTGVLNSGADWDTVRSQLQFLKGRGARSIRVVGVPTTGKYQGWNEQLQTLSDEAGATFLGGYTPGDDGVHMPDYSTYSVFRQL